MKEIASNGRRFRLTALETDGRWTVRAVREDTGQPFGVECRATTEADATARMIHWLEWQGAHLAALEALQAAEHAYHRAVASGAFANPAEELTSRELQRASLEAVEAARITLDDLRAHQPEV